MRKFILCLFALVLIISFALANTSSVEAAQKVKGYIKKNGTYVAPHFKTSPNKSKFDNFSTKGNINPFTGKKGTASPFKINIKKYR